MYRGYDGSEYFSRAWHASRRSNEALTGFVAQLLEHESYPYDLAFIESEEKVFHAS